MTASGRSILLMTTMALWPSAKAFRNTKVVCGIGPFFGVDQDEHAVHHAQGPFDFTAEVGVARRIDDIDLHALVDHAGVLGSDRDSALTFLVHRVHDPFAHIVDLAMDMGLSEHGIDQCRLAMVDVGDDRDISNIAPAVVGARVEW